MYESHVLYDGVGGGGDRCNHTHIWKHRNGRKYEDLWAM